jgi:hypothetical protein
MAPPRNTILLAAAGSAALALAAMTVFKSSPPSQTEAEVDLEDCIEADDVIAIFDDLFIHMQSVLAQLSQQIQQIQMAGQTIPEAQLRQLLKSEFERALKAKQSAIFDKHDVDEDCVKEATWEFMEMAAQGKGGPKVLKVSMAVERFRKLYENVSGEKVVGRLPGDGKGTSAETAVAVTVTKEQLIQAAKVYFDALTSTMATIVDKFKAEGKDMRTPAVAQEMQLQFAEKVNEAGEEALKDEGLTLDSFKAAIEKYSSDPEVGRTLQMLQMKQQQELMAMGVPAM